MHMPSSLGTLARQRGLVSRLAPTLAIFIIIFVSLGSSACDLPGNTKHPSSQVEIKANIGGKVTLGQATLTIPPGTLAGDATVTLTDEGKKDFLPAPDPGLQMAS